MDAIINYIANTIQNILISITAGNILLNIVVANSFASLYGLINTL